MNNQEESLVITSDISPQYNVSFSKEEKLVGKLFWDNGIMEFSGDMKESAERFFEFLKPYVDEYIRGHNGN